MTTHVTLPVHCMLLMLLIIGLAKKFEIFDQPNSILPFQLKDLIS